MKRLGPDLKLPDLRKLKVPTLVVDVYHDLRDRRLLPVVALVLVAIVAVPFLLGSEPEPLTPPPVAAGGANATVSTAGFAVVEAKPGLRAPGKRLRSRTSTNPFKQRYTGVPEEAQLQSTVSDAASGAAGEGSGESESTVPGSSTGSPASPGGSTGSGELDHSEDSGRRYFSYRPDIRFGVAGSGELNERASLLVGTLLPERNAVLVFLGVSESGKRALFHVSPEVVKVEGDGQCVGDRQNCGLLSLAVSEAANLLTDSPNRTFRIKVEEIEFIEVERPDPVKRKPAGASRAGEGAGSFTPAAAAQLPK